MSVHSFPQRRHQSPEAATTGDPWAEKHLPQQHLPELREPKAPSNSEATMKTYALGNCLRGYYEGEFSSSLEAYMALSRRFLIAYPPSHPEEGRGISLYVYEENKYGLKEYSCCRQSNTYNGPHKTDEDILALTKPSLFYR